MFASALPDDSLEQQETAVVQRRRSERIAQSQRRLEQELVEAAATAAQHARALRLYRQEVALLDGNVDPERLDLVGVAVLGRLAVVVDLRALLDDLRLVLSGLALGRAAGGNDRGLGRSP